jgi:hypothetical protein
MIVCKAWSYLMLLAIATLTPAIATAECPVCGNSNYDCQSNCKYPRKIVIKHKYPCCCIPQAPPYGFAVASAPIPTALFAAPLAVGGVPAGLTQDQIRQIGAEIRRQSAQAATADASSDLDCPTPCQDIKQLKRDVDDLRRVTKDLTAAVSKMSENFKKPSQP